jgi:hypothetical protein
MGWIQFQRSLASLLIILLSICCKAQTSQKSKQSQSEQLGQGKSRLSVEIEQLLGDIRSVPPEFSADLLLRLIISNKIPDREQKRDLLEEAFYKAADAQSKIKRKQLPGSLVDTRSGYLSRAYALNLDSLSLKSHAVALLLSVDARKARDLFNQIPKLDLPTLTCSDSLTYEVSDFYETLKEVAHKAFTPEEIRRGEHLFLIESRISDLISPVQVGPIAKVIMSFGKSPIEFGTLVRDFAAALKKIPSDARSFSVTWRADINNIGQLAVMCNDLSISNDDLLESLRSYLLSQVAATSCSDFSGKVIQEHVIDDFNKLIETAIRKEQNKVRPISADEAKPLKIENAANLVAYWQSPEAKSLLIKIKQLRFGTDNKPLTLEERKSLAWQQQLGSFLNDLGSWQATSEMLESDFFHQKSNLYRSLLDLTPPGSWRDQVLSGYVTLIRGSGLQQSNRIEWFLQAKFLADLINNQPAGNSSAIKDLMNDAAGTIVRLYGQLQKSQP